MAQSPQKRTANPYPKILNFTGPADFRGGVEAVYQRVEMMGYAVVRAWDTEPQTLLHIASHFGRVQGHPKAEATGVVTVRPEREYGTETFERNVSKTPAAFQLHTDGSFIDGVIPAGNKLFRMSPPSLFLLQCVQPAQNGGVSVLVDTEHALHALRQEAPYEAQMATEARVLTYFGGDQIALDFPLFERQSSGRYRVRFRADLAAVKPWAQDGIRKIVDEYLLSDRFAIRYRLESGDILIVDNQRIIHGRDTIALGEGGPQRTLRRTWIWDETNWEIAPLGGASAHGFVSPAMAQYAPIDNHTPSRPLALGVRDHRRQKSFAANPGFPNRYN